MQLSHDKIRASVKRGLGVGVGVFFSFSFFFSFFLLFSLLSFFFMIIMAIINGSGQIVNHALSIMVWFFNHFSC